MALISREMIEEIRKVAELYSKQEIARRKKAVEQLKDRKPKRRSSDG